MARLQRARPHARRGPAIPLLERVKFAAIFAGNLDEFYQVRVATLRQQEIAAPGLLSTDGLDATTQLGSSPRAPTRSRPPRPPLHTELKPRLARAGIRVLRWRQVPEAVQTAADCELRRARLPGPHATGRRPWPPLPVHLEPVAQPGGLAATIRPSAARGSRGSRCRRCSLGSSRPVTRRPSSRSRTSSPPTSSCLFPGMEILSRYPFRVTRASDLELDDDAAEDLLRALEAELRRRRFSPAVRLEVDRRMPAHLVDLLARELQLNERHVHRLGGPLGPRRPVERRRRSIDPTCRIPPFQPAPPTELVRTADGDVDIFATLDRRDLLRPPPLRLVRQHRAGVHRAGRGRSGRPGHQADAVPDVGPEPDRRRAGRTRPRPASRSSSSSRSRRASTSTPTSPGRGCSSRPAATSSTGSIGLKTHCKLALVVRKRARRDPALCPRRHRELPPHDSAPLRGCRSAHRRSGLAADVSQLFNLLTGYSRPSAYESMMVAPLDLRQRMRGHDPRAGRAGRGRRAGADRHEAQQPRRRAGDRRALRGVAGRRAGRPRRARHLRAASRRARD